MLESEIIKNLGLLKNISPKAEYSSLSRSIILSSKLSLKADTHIATDMAIVKKVSGLRNIFPSNEFARATRELILGRVLSPFNFARLGVKYGFSIAMAALLLVISVNSFFGAVPGADVKNLTAEADRITKDININLEGADYFATTANKARVALNDAKSNGEAEHSNQEIIKNEVHSFDFENPIDNDINRLLNEATI